MIHTDPASSGSVAAPSSTPAHSSGIVSDEWDPSIPFTLKYYTTNAFK
jgi:hypothetical protein